MTNIGKYCQNASSLCKFMRRQQNTMPYLFRSQLKVAIEHISLGKKLVVKKGKRAEKACAKKQISE